MKWGGTREVIRLNQHTTDMILFVKNVNKRREDKTQAKLLLISLIDGLLYTFLHIRLKLINSSLHLPLSKLIFNYFL